MVFNATQNGMCDQKCNLFCSQSIDRTNDDLTRFMVMVLTIAGMQFQMGR